MIEIHITVNGKPHALSVRPWSTLLEVIREKLGFTGTKKAAVWANAVRARSS